MSATKKQVGRSAQRAAAQVAERASAVAAERRRLAALWLMASSTLVWLPGGFTRFVFPKLVLVALACLLAAALPRTARLPRRITVTLVVAATVLTLASLVGQTPVASLVGRWPRYEGLPVLGLYAASVWLGARVVRRGRAGSVHLAHALAAMSLVLFAASLLDALGHSPSGPSSIDRSGSLLGNATDQGLVAMMAAVVIAAVLVERADPLLVAGALSALATVALSGSRIALGLTVLGVAVVVVARTGRRPDRRIVTGLAGTVAVLGLVAAAAPVTRARLLDTATGGVRLEQWRLTLRLVLDHPILGVGPSRYLDVFGTYESASFVRFTGVRTFADSPHDLVLQTAVAGGLPLVACLAALVWLAVRRAIDVVRQHPEAWGPAVAAAAYAVAMLANFTAAGSTCLAAFLAGSVLAEPVTDLLLDGADQRRERVRARLTATAFGIAAGVMAMSCVAEIELQHGFAAADRGDAAGARRDIDAAHGWRPLDGDVAMLGAQATGVLADAGDRAAAADTAALAEQALRRTPTTYSARVALGVARLAQGRPADAQEVLDQAVASFPHRPDAYVQRAVARVRLGDQAGARADLRAAARMEPRSPTIARLQRRLRG